MEHSDVIAILLAARHEPDIRDLADYQKAEERLRSDPDLQERFEAERAYYDQHEDFLANVRLPESVRARIRDRVGAARAEEEKLLFWPKRALSFAAAAAVLIMVGGFVMTRYGGGPAVVAQGETELQSLQTFAVTQVAQGALDLDQYSDEPEQLLTWLRERNAPTVATPPGPLGGLASMGCKIYEWNGNPVALVCFRTSAEEVVHLFVANQDGIQVAAAENQGVTRVIQDRETRSWVDGKHAFVLVAHHAGQSLNGLSG